MITESANQDKNNIEINVNVKCFVKQNSRDNERKRWINSKRMYHRVQRKHQSEI